MEEISGNFIKQVFTKVSQGIDLIYRLLKERVSLLSECLVSLCVLKKEDFPISVSMTSDI